MPEISQLKPFGKDGQLYDIRDDSKLPASGGTITGDLEIEGDLTLDSPLDISSGGTGASTAAGALTNLGAAAASHTHAASDISSGELPIARGGTGASTKVGAAENLLALCLGEAYSQIPSGANLNNYTTPGVYGILSSSVAATIVNNPSTRGASALRVWNGRGDGRSISDDGGMIMQEISDAYGCSWRRRAQNSSGTISWSPWNTGIVLGQSSYQIGTGQDLNSFTSPGVYAIAVNSIAQTLVHSPTDLAGTLRVWNAVGDGVAPGETWYYVMQEYINLYGDTWRRSGQSGSGTTITWEAWSYYAGRIPNMQTNLGLGTLQTYTPTFVWSDNSTLTTSSVFGYYSQIGRMLFVSARCRIKDLGTTGDKYLLMSLPSGYTTAAMAIYPTIGNVVPPIGHTYQYLIRPAGASSSNLSIHCGGGADFPRSVMITGYYAFMAIVPLE